MTLWLNMVLHKSFMKQHTYSNLPLLPSIYFSRKFSYKFGSSFFTASKLPSSNSFSNFNLKIYYPPPYKSLIWKYEKTNADLIKGAIRDFDWENKLSLIGINDQVALFNETIVYSVYYE